MRILLFTVVMVAFSSVAQAQSAQNFRDEYARVGRIIVHYFITLRDNGPECGGMGVVVSSAMNKIIPEFQQQSKRVIKAIEAGDKNTVANEIAELEKTNYEMEGKSQMIVGALSEKNPQCGKALRAYQLARAIALRLPDRLKQVASAL